MAHLSHGDLAQDTLHETGIAAFVAVWMDSLYMGTELYNTRW